MLQIPYKNDDAFNMDQCVFEIELEKCFLFRVTYNVLAIEKYPICLAYDRERERSRAYIYNISDVDMHKWENTHAHSH